jgi:hypothetical protein
MPASAAQMEAAMVTPPNGLAGYVMNKLGH